MPRPRIDTQRATLLRCGEGLFGELQSQLVRCQIIAQVGSLRGELLRLVRVLRHHSLEIRTVAADTDVDHAPLVIVKELDRVDQTGVDLFQVTADELLEAALAGDRSIDPVITTEVEVVEPVGPSLVARGDLIEFVFHRRGEVIVDQAGKVLLEQSDDRERHPRRDQGTALLVHIAPVLDGLDDRRVGRRSADAEVFQRLDQRSLGEAGRRAGGVPVSRQPCCVNPLPLGQGR